MTPCLGCGCCGQRAILDDVAPSELELAALSSDLVCGEDGDVDPRLNVGVCGDPGIGDMAAIYQFINDLDAREVNQPTVGAKARSTMV